MSFSPTEPRPASNPSPWWRGKLPLFIGIGLVVVFVIFLPRGGSSESGADRARAIIACQDAVREGLKSPSSASFSSDATGTDGSFKVRGRVDAENDFGAKVRATYTCDVTVNGKDASARVTSFDQ